VSGAGGPILVTGAAGWLGGALVPRLVAAGARVRCLAHERPVPGAAHETVRGDLRDPRVAAEATRGCVAVLHLAARTRARDARLYRELNVEATANLAEAAARAGVGRFVHVSSRTAVAGSGAYGESKLEGERRVLATLPAAHVLRPAEVYGAGSQDAVARLLALVARFPVVPSLADPAAKIAPLYVDDFLAATVRSVLDPTVPGGAYLLAGPEEVSIAEFLRRAARALDRHVAFLPVPRWSLRLAIALRVGDLTPDRLSALEVEKSTDIAAARRWLGFDPRALEAGVRAWAAARTA